MSAPGGERCASWYDFDGARIRCMLEVGHDGAHACCGVEWFDSPAEPAAVVDASSSAARAVESPRFWMLPSGAALAWRDVLFAERLSRISFDGRDGDVMRLSFRGGAAMIVHRSEDLERLDELLRAESAL